MALLHRGPVRLSYDIEGHGYPVLTLAPGGMRSANDLWNRMPWNPRTALRDTYQVIGMDQRNAGRSFAPVTGNDDWTTYAADQLALLDHLGVEHCHLVGMCIGGPFIMGLLAAAPSRFRSAVVLQPVGIADNRPALRHLFDEWAAAAAPDHPEATPGDWISLGDRLWGGELLLAVTRAQVAACTTPLLVLMGDDLYHPQTISRELAALAPRATLVERWKEAEVIATTDATIKRFLAEHTP
jgi:pimeloyl-ACP methyl ester carboxylesterase